MSYPPPLQAEVLSMCGRFAQLHPDVIALHFRARADDWVREARPSYNVAPSHRAVVVCRDRGRLANGMTWGFRDPRSASRLLINVRSETAAASPLFGPAWRQRRCAVPMELFYEWGGPVRRPHAVRAPDADWLVLAAIYEPEGRFAIVTGPSSGGLAQLHDRAPIFLHPDSLDAWLDPQAEPAAVLKQMGQPPADYLQIEPLSKHLNRRDASGPACLGPPTVPPGVSVASDESDASEAAPVGETLAFRFG
jgi:putative SOS response-associated peptidase YedK